MEAQVDASPPATHLLLCPGHDASLLTCSLHTCSAQGQDQVGLAWIQNVPTSSGIPGI